MLNFKLHSGTKKKKNQPKNTTTKPKPTKQQPQPHTHTKQKTPKPSCFKQLYSHLRNTHIVEIQEKAIQRYVETTL